MIPVAVQAVMDGVGVMKLLKSRRRHGVVTMRDDFGLAGRAVIVVVSSSAWLALERVLIEGETVVDEWSSAVGEAS